MSHKNHKLRFMVSGCTMLTGEKPRVMSILPFGCRVFAVKPRGAYSKTRLETRAWVGLNLGRSANIAGAYYIWVPSERRVVTTSEAYFSETSFPWRPTVAAPKPTPAQPSDGDADQPPGLPPGMPKPTTVDLPPNARALEKSAHSSQRALLLFSGSISRTDGIAAFLSRMGFESDCIDSDAQHGGGEGHNLLRDS
eukprot:221205-Pleurochrysis_carterae.AAC.1